MGSTYLDKGQVEDAASCFQKAITIQEKASNLAKVARASINLAIIYTIQGDWRKAEQYFKQAKANAERVGDAEAVAVSVGNLGEIYERQGRLSAAIRSYNEAKRSFGLSANLLQQALAEFNYGRMLLQQGKLPQALELFESSSHTATSLNVGWLVACDSSYLGMVRTALHHYDEAYQWLQRGYQKAKESGNSEVLVMATLNLGEFLLEWQPTNTISSYLNEAAPLTEQIGDPMIQGRLARMQGRLALQQQNFELATAKLEASLQIFEGLKAYLEMSYTKFYLAETLLERFGQFDLLVENQPFVAEAHVLVGGVQPIATIAVTSYNQDYERAQVLLQQAVETFRACEANLILPKALALLEKYAPVHAA
jgi:tetratricopeptide (TPR) repeat protein